MCYCIEAFTKKDFKKHMEFVSVDKKIKDYYVVSEEDIRKITQILWKYTIIEPETIGSFLRTPIKNKDILKKYFKFYSHYYTENGVPEEAINELIKIYNKYKKDSSNLVNEWINLVGTDKSKYVGCLEGRYNIDKNKINENGYLKNLLKEVQEDYNFIAKTKHFRFCLEKVKEDIRILKKAIKLKNKGYILVVNN